MKRSLRVAMQAGRAWPALAERSRAQTLMIAAALFAAIAALRFADPEPADATLVLCVVPIAICAISYGPLGGMLASLVGVALTVAWTLYADAGVGPVGYGARIVAFVVVGVVVGRYATERRALERRLDRAYDVAVDLHCTAGFDGYFQRVNPAGCALLGYSEAELLTRPFLDLVHPEDRERTVRESAQLGSGEDCTVGFENRYRTRDGSYRWLAWTSRAVPGDDLIYATARDVTDQHEQHVELERLVGDRTRELQAARFENLRRLALAAEYRDDDTHRHTERVGALARLLSEQLGLSDEFTDRLGHAAPLHDVGKLGVPDAILLKPGRLTDEERLLMQKHTLMGAGILAGSNFPVLQLGTEIALTHHERWDGAGYPAGTAGEAIPISGRIVAVADVFDALTHERPYKPAWPLEEAVAEIMAGSATQFDAAVVAAFQALHEQGILPAFVQAAPASQLAKRTRQAAAA